jgi:hypothetical protein
MILVDALYIHTGGSKVLLEYLLKELLDRNLITNYYFLIDCRLKSNYIDKINNDQYKIIKGKEFDRKLFYKRNCDKFSRFFCMANVPPPIRIKYNDVFILFHNAHILNSINSVISIYSAFKYVLKKQYIFLINSRKYIWIVQTQNMEKLLSSFFKFNKIEIIPFFELCTTDSLLECKNIPNFIYVADGQPQKNHRFLLKTWDVLFSNYNINYNLYLTIGSNYKPLLSDILDLNKKGIKIINLGHLSHHQVLNYYKICEFLLYPSYIESFGLPLIEAVNAGCKVISINKPYIYDVVLPSETFNEFEVNKLVDIIIKIKDNIPLKESKIIISNQIDKLFLLLHE